MKKRNIFLLLTLTSLLVGCNYSFTPNGSDNSESSDNPSEPESNPGEVTPTTSIQDMNILHAWNWKMTDIASRLDMIKKAGFKAIQISPMQPKQDGNNWSDQTTYSQWWKLYQPNGFTISEGNDSFLGTKTQLTSLCTAAKNKGLKIVVDVVANHLSTKQNDWKQSYPRHNYSTSIDYNNRESIVKGDMGGLPDVDTHSSSIQNAVKELLIDYIRCGVSGFRFDAAKHIETPDDNNSYKSNFWPTVLNGATQYAQDNNLEEPYYYGEVLNEVGPNCDFSMYTKMMSICDNKQATDVVNAIHNSSTSKLKANYNTGADGNKLVLWAESHDTYANDSGYEITRSFPSSEINKAYMIQASRKDAATLYLARPSSLDAKICSIDTTSGWNNNEVKAANQFHARYVGKKESISIDNNKYFVNVRGTGDFAGAMIVNVNGSNSATVNVANLPDGEYKDLISNNLFTVNNGKSNIAFTNGGCILVPKDADDEDEGGSETITYNSDIVLQNYNSSCYYYAWVFDGSQSDKWIKLQADHDALGFNIGNYQKYIIVEMKSDNPDWNNKNWQTDNIVYSGSQKIYDCNSIPKKS